MSQSKKQIGKDIPKFCPFIKADCRRGECVFWGGHRLAISEWPGCTYYIDHCLFQIIPFALGEIWAEVKFKGNDDD